MVTLTGHMQPTTSSTSLHPVGQVRHLLPILVPRSQCTQTSFSRLCISGVCPLLPLYHNRIIQAIITSPLEAYHTYSWAHHPSSTMWNHS